MRAFPASSFHQPPLVTASDSQDEIFAPESKEPPALTETTPLVTSHEISLLRRVLAHLAGFLAGAPSTLTMLDLSTDAMDILMRGTKDPEFYGTWERIREGNDVPLALAICVSYALSFLAMAPFNYYNTYKGIISGGARRDDERDRILKVIDGLDDYAIKPVLKVLFGAPIGTMLGLKTYPELFGRSPEGRFTLLGLTIPNEAFLMTWWGILSAGIPIGNVVTGVLTTEMPRLVHNIGRCFFSRGRKIADLPGLTANAIRSELMSMLFDALNSAQLLHRSKLKDIDPQGDEKTIIAQLLFQETPKLKVWISEFIMRALGFYLVYYGTPFFKDLGEGAILYTIQALGLDSEMEWAKKLGATGGFVSLLGFFLLWGMLMSDAVHRPFMRIFAEGKMSDSEIKGFLQTISNFDSWREAGNYLLAYLFGAGLGVTNLPFIARDQYFIVTAICSFLANASVSANGFNFGRKDMGLMQKDFHDLLGGRIFGLLSKVATMSDGEVFALVDGVKTKMSELEQAHPTEESRLLPARSAV